MLGDLCGVSSTDLAMIAASGGEDGNVALSSEDSSCPDDTETELDLALGLSIGLKGHRNISGVQSSSSLSSSSSSSTIKESISGAIKRTADSSALSNGTGQVIGWPPIRTYRINSLVNQAKCLAAEGSKDASKTDISKKKDDNGSNAMGITIAKETSSFVKVTMDGIAIGRKVDLSVHSSYEALLKTLEEMFLQPLSTMRLSEQRYGEMAETRHTKLLDSSSRYVLTYKDKDGDWMLVGDVPWKMFVGTVKRLRIMRASSDATRKN